jgi:hypothetical protein
MLENFLSSVLSRGKPGITKSTVGSVAEPPDSQFEDDSASASHCLGVSYGLALIVAILAYR